MGFSDGIPWFVSGLLGIYTLHLATRLDDLSQNLEWEKDTRDGLCQKIQDLERDIRDNRTRLQGCYGLILDRIQAQLSYSGTTINDLREELRKQGESNLSALSDHRRDMSMQVLGLRGSLEYQQKSSSERDDDLQLQIHGLTSRTWALEIDHKSYVQTTPRAETKPDEFIDNPDSDVTKIIAIIDGDGHIFNTTLIKRGKQGGIEAAKLLTDGLTSSYFRSRKSPYQGDWSSVNSDGIEDDIQIWVYIFLSRRGLQHALSSRDICTSSQYENFLAGFTQFNPRFMVCDVHSGKDAADLKVREFLLNYARLPQYRKVFFGGGHDSGYSATLRVLENEGLLNKVVLLQGYKTIATKISSFQLPELVIDGLFMEEPLSARISKTISPVHESDEETEDQFGLFELAPGPSSHTSSSSTSGFNLSIAKDTDGATQSKTSVTPIQLSTFPPLNNDPEIELKVKKMIEDMSPIRRKRRSENRRRGGNDNSSVAQAASPEKTKIRLEDRPPGAPSPCYYFYLAECKAGNNCPLGHFYILQPKDMKHLKSEAPHTPCLAVQKNLPCVLASNCPMAHRCPHGPGCKQYKDGGRRGCRFKGDNMHSL